MTVLYNLRTDGDHYRITKFTDGNPEGSYLVDHATCQCPAGERPTCRHRQMLPELLSRHMADSGLFWDFDRKFSCDINGNPQRTTIPAPEGPKEVEPALANALDRIMSPDFPTGVAKPVWRRI